MAYEFPGLPPISTGDRIAQSQYDWLADVVDALSVLNWFVRALFGDTNGVIAYGTVGTDSLKVEATSSAESMYFTVHEGAGFVDGVPFRFPTQTLSTQQTAPVANDRIDTIALSATNGVWAITVHEGEEDSSPVAPAILSGEIKLAEIYHRVSETAIYDTDVSAEGYITDSRTFVNV